MAGIICWFGLLAWPPLGDAERIPLTNAGLESGDAGWTSISVVPHARYRRTNNTREETGAGFGVTFSASNGAIQQTKTPFMPNTHYRLSALVGHFDQAGSINFEIGYLEDLANPDSFRAVASRSYPANTGQNEWLRLDPVEHLAKANAPEVTQQRLVAVRLHSRLRRKGAFWFDNVILDVETPDRAALARATKLREIEEQAANNLPERRQRYQQWRFGVEFMPVEIEPTRNVNQTEGKTGDEAASKLPRDPPSDAGSGTQPFDPTPLVHVVVNLGAEYVVLHPLDGRGKPLWKGDEERFRQLITEFKKHGVAVVIAYPAKGPLVHGGAARHNTPATRAQQRDAHCLELAEKLGPDGFRLDGRVRPAELEKLIFRLRARTVDLVIGGESPVDVASGLCDYLSSPFRLPDVVVRRYAKNELPIGRAVRTAGRDFGDVAADVAECIGTGVNCELRLAVSPAGQLAPEQTDAVAKLSDWTKAFGPIFWQGRSDPDCWHDWGYVLRAVEREYLLIPRCDQGAATPSGVDAVAATLAVAGVLRWDEEARSSEEILSRLRAPATRPAVPQHGELRLNDAPKFSQAILLQGAVFEAAAAENAVEIPHRQEDGKPLLELKNFNHSRPLVIGLLP